MILANKKKIKGMRSPFLNGEQEGREEAQFLWYKKDTALMAYATWKNCCKNNNITAGTCYKINCTS
jgi:hypothetical protein